MNDKNLEIMLANSIYDYLPKITSAIKDLNENLHRQNAILADISKSLKKEKDVIISIRCTDMDDVKRIIKVSVNDLIEDWENECNVCPENDAEVYSAIICGKELIGTILQKKSDFENLMYYLVNGEVAKTKTLTIEELKDVFKKNKWKFIRKEKVDFKKIKSTEQFIFEKKIRTKQATVWLSFNSLNDVKEYYYDIELSNSKTKDYNSYGNVSDIYESIQDVVKVLNENLEEFE